MKALDFLEATGRIDDNIILEVTSSMQKNITHTPKPHKRILVLAAAVVLILSLGVVSYATGFFGLMNLSVDGKHGPTVIADAGHSLTAAEEWRIYLEENEKTNVLTPNTPIDICCDYGAFTQEAKDKLTAIVQQYGLKLFTDRSQCGSVEELYKILHTDAFLPAGSGNGSGTVFDGSSVYSFISDAVLSSGKTVYYDLYLVQDGYFMNPVAMLTDAKTYEETSTSVSGVDVTLALGADRSYILAETEDYSLTVYIRSGSENTNENLSSFEFETVTMDDLKQLAESIDLAAIANIYK